MNAKIRNGKYSTLRSSVVLMQTRSLHLKPSGQEPAQVSLYMHRFSPHRKHWVVLVTLHRSQPVRHPMQSLPSKSFA